MEDPKNHKNKNNNKIKKKGFRPLLYEEILEILESRIYDGQLMPAGFQTKLETLRQKNHNDKMELQNENDALRNQLQGLGVAPVVASAGGAAPAAGFFFFF